jgi:hypothetical protein
MQPIEQEVSGHDFTTENATDGSRSVKARLHNRKYNRWSKKCQGTTSQQKMQPMEQEVSGHDFSRAEKAPNTEGFSP